LAPKPFTAQQIQGSTIYRSRYGRVKEGGTTSNKQRRSGNNNQRAGAATQLLNYSHEVERTPFQTHFFSEKLVASEIEPVSLDL
jgi:hypothetical protein